MKKWDKIKELTREMEILKETRLFFRARFPMLESEGRGRKTEGKSVESEVRREYEKLERQIASDEKALADSLEEAYAEIRSIDDPLIRQAYVLRYLRGYSWEKVAARLGGGNTADGIKSAVRRFEQRKRKNGKS